MNIFGIDFTAAEVVLLVILLGVIICLFVVLRRLRPQQQQTASSQQHVATPVATQTDDLELVAVLTAAAAAYMGVEPESIQLSSYQSVENKLKRSRWSRAGRTEQFSRG